MPPQGHQRKHRLALVLLVGAYTDFIHMAGDMPVRQLSVLIVVLNGVRVLRVSAIIKASTAIAQAAEHAAA